MSIGLEFFPRDINAQIPGKWRLKHRSDTFNESFNGVVFKDGVTITPVEGISLIRLVCAMGHELDAEPWGDSDIQLEEKPLPKFTVGRRAYRVDKPQEATVNGDSVEPAEQSTALRNGIDEYEGMDRDQLIAIAEAKGLEPDRRWGAERLRKYIREGY